MGNIGVQVSFEERNTGAGECYKGVNSMPTLVAPDRA